jgi:hypothetical protein
MLLRFEVNGTAYEIDPASILNTEAIQAQKVTGYGYDEWLTKCDENDPTAVTAIVWITMRRTEEFSELRFTDVQFSMRETWGNRELVPDTDTPTTPAEAGQTEKS